MPVEQKLDAREIANRIRAKVQDLNDELTLAKLAEVDVELTILNHTKYSEGAVWLRVWCSQEVR